MLSAEIPIKQRNSDFPLSREGNQIYYSSNAFDRPAGEDGILTVPIPLDEYRKALPRLITDGVCKIKDRNYSLEIERGPWFMIVKASDGNGTVIEHHRGNFLEELIRLAE